MGFHEFGNISCTIVISGVIFFPFSFFFFFFWVYTCIWTLKHAAFKCLLMPENKKVKLILSADCLALTGTGAVHKLLMFASCCSLCYLLIMWISEAPAQQDLHLQLESHPCCLRFSQILPWIVLDCYCLLIFSSEGRNVFITGSDFMKMIQVTLNTLNCLIALFITQVYLEE